MDLRLVVPLPGPFAWVGDGAAGRAAKRRAREEKLANMTDDEQRRAGLIFVGLFWLLATSWAGHYFGSPWAVIVAGLGLLYLRRCVRFERARKAAIQAEFERLQAERS